MYTAHFSTYLFDQSHQAGMGDAIPGAQADRTR